MPAAPDDVLSPLLGRRPLNSSMGRCRLFYDYYPIGESDRAVIHAQPALRGIDRMFVQYQISCKSARRSQNELYPILSWPSSPNHPPHPTG